MIDADVDGIFGESNEDRLLWDKLGAKGGFFIFIYVPVPAQGGETMAAKMSIASRKYHVLLTPAGPDAFLLELGTP